MANNSLESFRARRREIQPELVRLGQMPGKLSAPQQLRWNELTTEATELDDKIADLEERQRLAASATPLEVSDVSEWRPVDHRGVALRQIERSRFGNDDHKQAATKAVEQDGTGGVARHAGSVIGSDAYLRAYSKIFKDPQNGHRLWDTEELRAFQAAEEYRAMTAGTGSTGGFYVPLMLDPTMVITGAGSTNPYRKVANVKQINTLIYNGATSAQVSAGLVGENSAFTDNAPTVSQVQITTYKAGAYIPASFEAFEDIDALANDVLELFRDARDNFETTQLTTGSGSAPQGIITAVGAVTASRVSPATGGTFAVADVYTVHGALSPRYRSGNPAQRAWMGSVQTIDKMRQFATANNYMAFLSDMSEGQPSRLLGDALYECSAMATAFTTGSDTILYGDFSRFYLIDRIGLQTEFIPNIVNSSALPIGQRAWLMHWRFGSSCPDPAAFRLLRL